MRRYAAFLLTALTLIVFLPGLALPAPAAPDLPQPAEFARIREEPRRYTILGYEREAFGSGWGPAPEQPGCTSREQAILTQSQPEVLVGCDMEQGVLFDLYNQRDITITASTRVEVDHVFPLSAAWDMGAWRWDNQTRQSFANDPLNLVVTARETNQDKSDQLPSRWMPPHPGSRCWYAQKLAAVALAYDLALPHDDLATMRRACRFGTFRMK